MLHNRARLLKIMAANKVDYLISSSPENFMYLAEFYSLNHWQIKSTLAFVVYPRDEAKNPIMVIPQGDLDNLADKPSWIKDFKSYGKCIIEEVSSPPVTEADKRYKLFRSQANDYSSAMQGLTEAMKSFNYKAGEKIAFDERCVPFQFVREFETNIKATVEPGQHILQKTRQVKTEEEVARLQKAITITEDAIRATLDQTTMGMTEKEMLFIYNQEVCKRGALPSLNCMLVGEHSAYANGQATDRVVKRDQLIRFDIGCTYEFYHADTAQNAVFGSLTDRHHDCFEAIKAGVALGIEHMKPGVDSSEIYHLVMNRVKEGIPQIYRHHIGHGIGIEVYDPPMITDNTGFFLEENMVFCVEVPYYEFEFGGLQVEEVVQVTPGGGKVLSRRPVEIIQH